VDSETPASQALNAKGSAKRKGPLGIVLAGSWASFRREIKPYQEYEVWTRVIAWDEKWLYFGSWFVKTGALKGLRKQVALQYGPRTRGSKTVSREEAEKAVLAIVVSKNIIKMGRTVRPEALWLHRGLVGPDIWSSYQAETARGLEAVQTGDQSILMDMFIDMVVDTEGAQILGEYRDIWALV
jgi:hypothetical protein